MNFHNINYVVDFNCSMLSVFDNVMQLLYILTYGLLLVVRQHLIGSQVLTRCPPLFVVHGIQAVVESRSSREIDNIPQI